MEMDFELLATSPSPVSSEQCQRLCPGIGNSFSFSFPWHPLLEGSTAPPAELKFYLPGHRNFPNHILLENLTLLQDTNSWLWFLIYIIYIMLFNIHWWIQFSNILLQIFIFIFIRETGLQFSFLFYPIIFWN